MSDSTIEQQLSRRLAALVAMKDQQLAAAVEWLRSSRPAAISSFILRLHSVEPSRLTSAFSGDELVALQQLAVLGMRQVAESHAQQRLDARDEAAREIDRTSL